MANSNKVVGQLKVKIDGEIYETDGTTEMEIGGTSRDPVEGDNQASAFKAKTNPSKTTTALLYKNRLRLSDVRNIENATLTLETDAGHVWIVRNAYSQDVPSFSTSDGKAKVVFGGPPAEEMTV